MEAGLIRDTETAVYDPYLDATGHVDMIDTEGNPIEIKSTTTEALASMKEAKWDHYVQTNCYMRSLGKKKARILYVSRDDPSVQRTFDVGYSSSVMRKVQAKVELARASAVGAHADGYIPRSYGYSYSHVDRLKILANVAPYSEDYQEELSIVRELDRMGDLDERDQEKYADALKMQSSISRKYDFQPYRFKGREFAPGKDDYRDLGLNEHAKPADKYDILERFVGSAWERFSHLDTPLHLKLLHNRSPREEYERTIMMGRTQAKWGSPNEDFIKPWFKKWRTDQGMATDMAAAASTGFAFGGGPVGAVFGAAVAIPAHAFKKGASALFGDYVPGEMKDKWETDRTIKQVEFARNSVLASEKGESEYRRTASASPMSYDLSKMNEYHMGTMYKAVTKEEQGFIQAFARESNKKERREIRKDVSPQARSVLDVLWAKADGDFMKAKAASHGYSKYMHESFMYPDAEWSGYNQAINQDDINIEIVEEAGLDAHDFGLGFAAQQYRRDNLPYKVSAPTYRGSTSVPQVAKRVPGTGVDNNAIRDLITGIIKRITGTSPSVQVSDSGGTEISLSIHV